jgi:hypothetical protein
MKKTKNGKSLKNQKKKISVPPHPSYPDKTVVYFTIFNGIQILFQFLLKDWLFVG